MTLTIVKQDAPTLVVGVGAFDSAAGAAIMASHTAFGLTLDASANATEARATLQVMDFFGRPSFVTWAASNTVPQGHIINAGGFTYQYIGSGTAISDLPGWVPFGRVYPDHFKENSIPGTTSMKAAIQAADDYITNGGILYFKNTNYVWDSAGTKSTKTFWIGEMSNAAFGAVGSMITFKYNGSCIVMTGTNVNYQGGVQGIRFLGDRSLYPEAVAFDMANVNDHFFNNTYMGNLKFGVRGVDCKTFNFNWFYGFGMLQDSVYLYGTAPDKNTDHCFSESQFAGDRYGLHLENGGAMHISNSRPQVSGVANCYFDTITHLNMSGGYCDSARAYNSDTGTGDGIVIRNCIKVSFSNIIFYSNGAGAADLRVIADNFISTDFIFEGNTHTLGTSGTRSAIIFDTPIGTGQIRRVMVNTNNFVGMTTPIANPDNVATELRCGQNQGLNKYVGVAGPVADFVYNHFSDVIRITGTLNTSFNVTVPNARGFVGDRLVLVRVNAGTGTVTFLGPNGTAIGTLSGAGKLEAVCIQASTTPGSTSYVAI